MHLTVLFLGEQAGAQLPGIVGSARAFMAGAPVFELAASEVTGFSRPPRLLYVAFSEVSQKPLFEPVARGLHATLDRERVLSAAVVVPRRVTPHLTLVRFRGRREQQTLERVVRWEHGRLLWEIQLPSSPADAVVRCERMKLFHSILGPNGPRYEVIDEFMLDRGPKERS